MEKSIIIFNKESGEVTECIGIIGVAFGAENEESEGSLIAGNFTLEQIADMPNLFNEVLDILVEQMVQNYPDEIKSILQRKLGSLDSTPLRMEEPNHQRNRLKDYF